MTLFTSIIFIFLSLAMQAFFAGSEMGIISSNKIKISHRALKGDRLAKYIEKFLENPEDLFGTTLVGVNLAVVAGSSIAASIASGFFDNPDTAAAVSTVVMLPLVLIFGQIVPMTFARKHSTSFSLVAVLPLKIAYFALFPLVFFASRLAGLFSKIFGRNQAKKSYFVTRDELKLLIKEGMKRGIADDVVMDMAYEIFDFSKTVADDIIIHLKNVVSVSKDVSVQDLISTVVNTGYSWVPVYGEGPGNIVGVVKATDLLTEEGTKKALDVIRPCYLVREDELLEDILKKMQMDKVNFAIVSDSAGKLKGIVTLEDIIEEIVGEIEDEYAPKKAK